MRISDCSSDVCSSDLTDASAGAKGISLFVVETDKVEGFTRGRLLDKLGQEGRDTAELFFSDMRVPAENLLGGVEGRGFPMLMEKLPQERMVIAWPASGMIEAALEVTLVYVRARKDRKSVVEGKRGSGRLALGWRRF